jgi:hypothetical protein
VKIGSFSLELSWFFTFIDVWLTIFADDFAENPGKTAAFSFNDGH